jgi:hypothetical protein
MAIAFAANLLPNYRIGPSVTLFGFDIILVDSIAEHFPSDPQKFCRFFLIPVGFHQLTDNPFSFEIRDHLHQLDLTPLFPLFLSLL